MTNEPKNNAPSRYIHRDLSWLSFNERVLQEAEDSTVPLLERLKFLAIYSNNLDEFYRVRISALRGMKQLRKEDRQRGEKKPGKALKTIQKVVLQQLNRFGHIFRDQILPTLQRQGICMVTPAHMTPNDLRIAKEKFGTKIFQHLQVQILDLESDETVFLENKKLYHVVDLPGDQTLGLVNIPVAECGRFITLTQTDDETRIALLDDILRVNLQEIFHNAKAAYSIKVSRDAELYIEDEYAGDLIERLRAAVSQRDEGLPTRLLFDASMPSELLKKVKVYFRLKKLDLQVGGRFHNFSDFFDFPTLYDRNGLYYPPQPPLPHPRLELCNDLVAEVGRRDIILHFPYQKFDYVPRLMDHALQSDACTGFKMTLYRTSKNSIIGSQLLKALKHGKQVTVFIEAKARFDEENNLFWGQQFEAAGARVIYSYPGIKVHSKLLLIQFEGQPDLAYIGTGNFNERTARIYADHALITAEKKITSEVAKVFSVLERETIIPRAKHLLVSPFTTRSGITDKIDHQIALARQGKKAGLAFKMNSLEDRKMVKKLYEAVTAGVKVRMLVRGICVLNPDFVEGNLEVISIVDRYLEHARIYLFGLDDQQEMYIGSADLMERNLDRRIEVLTPIYDRDVFSELVTLFEMQWQDNQKARLIDGLQINTYRRMAPGKKAHRAQYDIYAFLAAKTPIE